MDNSTSRAIEDVADESGVTAIEYGLLASLIAIGCLAAFGIFAGALQDLFTQWIIPALSAL